MFKSVKIILIGGERGGLEESLNFDELLDVLCTFFFAHRLRASIMHK